jgi:hypothetical protein
MRHKQITCLMCHGRALRAWPCVRHESSSKGGIVLTCNSASTQPCHVLPVHLLPSIIKSIKALSIPSLSRFPISMKSSPLWEGTFGKSLGRCGLLDWSMLRTYDQDRLVGSPRCLLLGITRLRDRLLEGG